jgi:hypothetical protein
MPTIQCIVEGQGEVKALRTLIWKLIDWEHQHVTIATPKNAKGHGDLTKPGGIERFLKLAEWESECDGVLVLLDADEECAAERARGLAARARELNLSFPVAVVCAKCEYEAWFLASLETIAGHFDIPADARFEGDVEKIRDAKGWLSSQMPRGRTYKGTLNQASMTDLLDPDLVRPQSRSFRRLEHAIQELLGGGNSVTPE